MGDLALDLARAIMPYLADAQGKGLSGLGVKHDASGTPIATGYSHGPGGVLTYPGVERDVMHTIVGNIGILSQLPTKSSVYTNPVYEIITGVQDVSGDEPATPCDDAPTAGLIKACKLTAPFGRYERSTPELELNRLGQVNDRADPMDLMMVGSPIHQTGLFATGPGDPSVPGEVLSNEMSRKFFELGTAFHRLISVQLWQGDPANNNAGGGYSEITGFDQLINTGYVDVETNTSCPSVDADLKDFGCLKVDDNADTLIDMLSSLIRTRRDLAFRTGVSPVRWVLAMRPELFWEVTAIWPCNYLTYRCDNLAAQQQVTVEASQHVAMRDAMRAGRYLMIDGDQIPVILDDGIQVDTPTTNSDVNEGCQCSDIYLIPMSIMGGRATTYLEYFDYNNSSAAQALGNDLLLGKVEGAFVTTMKQTLWCIKFQSKIEPRLVLRTPWLSGRVQNVEYCPTQQARTPFPDDPYFVDGGETERPGPSHYALWQD